MLTRELYSDILSAIRENNSHNKNNENYNIARGDTMLNLKKMRVEKKLTQEALSQLVGVDRTLIGKIEKGSKPGIKTAQKIAEVFGVSWTEFFDTANDKTKI